MSRGANRRNRKAQDREREYFGPTRRQPPPEDGPDEVLRAQTLLAGARLDPLGNPRIEIGPRPDQLATIGLDDCLAMARSMQERLAAGQPVVLRLGRPDPEPDIEIAFATAAQAADSALYLLRLCHAIADAEQVFRRVEIESMERDRAKLRKLALARGRQAFELRMRAPRDLEDHQEQGGG